MRRHLRMDFSSILVDFGSQVGRQNRAMIAQKWHRKNDEKKKRKKVKLCCRRGASCYGGNQARRSASARGSPIIAEGKLKNETLQSRERERE